MVKLTMEIEESSSNVIHYGTVSHVVLVDHVGSKQSNGKVMPNGEKLAKKAA